MYTGATAVFLLPFLEVTVKPLEEVRNEGMHLMKIRTLNVNFA